LFFLVAAARASALHSFSFLSSCVLVH
jgi:hypothetical protein